MFLAYVVASFVVHQWYLKHPLRTRYVSLGKFTRLELGHIVDKAAIQQSTSAYVGCVIDRHGRQCLMGRNACYTGPLAEKHDNSKENNVVYS